MTFSKLALEKLQIYEICGLLNASFSKGQMSYKCHNQEEEYNFDLL